MKGIQTILICVFLSACVNSHQRFYKPVAPQPLDELEFLSSGEAPKISSTHNFERDVKILLSRRYTVIGVSHFNGKLAGKTAVLRQAKRVKAKIALVGSKFIGAQTTTTPLFLPTSFGTSVVPITNSHHRYDQKAIYFAKNKRPYAWGMYLQDLTPEQRQALETNTGARVYIVIEDTPAFHANFFTGDVLIEINGLPVRNAAHGLELMAASGTGTVQVTILRSKEKREISIEIGDA